MVITLFHYLQTKINTLQKTIQEQHPRKLGIIVVTRLFLLEMCFAVAKYFVLLFKDSYTSFVALCNQPVLKVCPYSYVEHKTFQKRLRLFSAAGLVVLVLATSLSSLLLNLATGPILQSRAASHTWTQSSWSGGQTSNNAGHNTSTNQPASGWTEYSSSSGVTASDTVAVTAQNNTWNMTDTGTGDSGFNNTGAIKSNTVVSSSGGGAIILDTSGRTVSWAANTNWDTADVGMNGAPALADLDNDGDFDLMVGENTGIVLGYENTGNNSSPTWTRKATWDTADLGLRAGPALADLDNDGDLDLLIGENSGTTYGYENTGNATSPTWTAKSTWNVSSSGQFEPKPALADLDNDGDLDLMMGRANGTTIGYRNTGNATSPTWTANTDWNISDVGDYSYPALKDLDDDGDSDLMIGENTGVTLGYENTGNAASPTWAAKADWNIPIGVSTKSAPASADLDNDGDFDLLIGKSGGTNTAYQNTGSLLYITSGTFTSQIYNTSGDLTYGILSWTATLNSGSVTMKVRTCDDSACLDETDITSCADVASGTTLSGANACISDGDQWVQFQATLNASGDRTQTPYLNDVSILYTNYPTTTQTLISSAYNTAQAASIAHEIAWINTSLPSGTEVKFQIRSAADNGSGAPGTWSNWCGYEDSGSTCSGSNYFDASENGQTLADTHPLKSAIFSTPELNDQWIQYQTSLVATAIQTPSLDSVSVTYVINTAPSFDTDYGSGGIAVTDNLDGTYTISFKPKDEDSQDSNNAYPGPGYVCPTFEYYNGSAWGTIPAAALNLDTISAASKNTASTCGSGLPALAVSESAYGDPNNSLQPYTVGWNAESHVSANTYTAGAKVRITAHDGEAANYQTTATYSGTFTIDVAAPSLTSTPAILDASQSPALLTFDTVTEPNTPQMKVGLASDLSDASWETAASTKSVTLPSSASTVYYQFKDSYNNQTSIRSIAPLQSLSGIMVQDITNVKTTPYEYRLFISWQPKTDASAFTSYEVFRSTDSASFSSTPVKTITDITTNYFVDSTATSMVADTTYYYKVRYQDKTNLGADPNRNSISYYTSTIEAKANGVQDFGEGGGGTPADPPTITIGSNPVSGITTQSATITWKTDKLSDSLVEYGTVAGSYALSQGVTSMVSGTEAGSTDHQVTLIGLSPNTTYYFRVKSTDIYNNLRTDDNSGQGYSFATLNGPRISDVRAEDIANTSVKIIWNTDRDSSSYVVYSINSDMTDSQEAGTSILVGGGGPNYYHTVSVSSLTTGTTYYYYVKSIDSENNTAVNNNGLTYYTLKTTSDTTAPALSNITVSTTTPDTAVITWTTNEPATSVAEYGISAFESTSSDTTLAISHVVALTNLQPETTYTFRITSSDSSGNESVSDNQTLATLKESEIKTDQTAPTITNISVGGITSNSAIVTFTTNETCLDSINYGTTTSYNKGVTDVEAGVSHSIKINDLSPSTPYHFQVYCRDSSGNVGSSSDQTFTTLAPTATGEGGKTEAEKRIEGLINENFSPEDLRDAIKKLQSPPIITGTGPEVSEIRSNSAKVEWKTDKKANCILIYSNNESKITSFKAKPGSVDTTDGLIEVSDTEEQALAHELVLTNLTPGTTYYFMAGSKDVYGNLTLSDKKSFSTLVVPMISGVEISNTTLSSVAISWNTSVVTTGFIEYGKDINYGSTKEYDDKTTKGTKHSLVLSNLDPTTTYHFRIKGTSSSDSSLISSEDYTFNTQALPTISKEEIKKITDNSAKITFETNIETDTQVLYKPLKKTSSTIPLSPGETGGDLEVNVISYQSKGKPDLTKNHEITLENLEFGTDYDIKIKVKDAFDNTAEKQLPTFTTGIDITPPAISLLRTENALIPGKKDKVQTIISWKTDEPSTTQIMYQEGIDLKRTDLKEKTSEDKNFTKDHVIVLTNLKPGTVYQLKAVSKDNQNNETTSNNQTMLTPKQQESVFQVIMKNLEDVFGWVKKIR